MNIIYPFIVMEDIPNNGIDILKKLEKAGRTCYKSEVDATEQSSIKFIQTIIKQGHESVLEHEKLTVRIVCDRGVSHELVRHRVASFSQESTRYCNYSQNKFGNELTFIKPSFWEYDTKQYKIWEEQCEKVEKDYFELLSLGATPQEARTILPNSLKTEIVVTANLREWRHILKLRTSKQAHPQMREIMNMLLDELKEKIIIIFDDIKENEL